MAMLTFLLVPTPAYVLPHARLAVRTTPGLVHHDHSTGLPLQLRPRSAAPHLTSLSTAQEVTSEEIQSPDPMEPPLQRVFAAGCPSCEAEWLQSSKAAEKEEALRLEELRESNLTTFFQDIWDYAQRMNDTQRQEVALEPDTQLRNFVISSSTPPSLLMETVYNNTLQRVPYEQACYICGPEQAMLLRVLVGLAKPRQCLDIGSFTGYASSAVLEALPDDALLTCLEVEEDFTELAKEELSKRNAKFILAPAQETLAKFEQEGRVFDFITLDADKPMHGEYYNMSLRLLRPGGILVMFGMLLFPTIEDQEAMEKLHTQLPNDTRITTAQLPVGCGIQLMVKLGGTTPELPLTEEQRLERRRWELESEIAAIDRYIVSAGVPLGGAASVGPGIESLSSMGLVAMQATRRAAEEAAAAMAEEAAQEPV